MKPKLTSPFLGVNPKSYLYGDESLELAKAADAIAAETGLSMFFTCPFADIRYIKENTSHLLITAQHMEPLVPGRGMGHVLPESLKAAGAGAVFLNHAENPLTLSNLYHNICRARELEMLSIVCADSADESAAVAELGPDIILSEPTALIGTGQAADNRYIHETIRRIHAVNDQIQVIIASGITTADDVYNVIHEGGDGSCATSGILGAPDRALRIEEMAKAALKGFADR